eukprot:SAG31_NODE_1259_length_9077_cov_3.520049_8_plen_52_part_00
MAALNLIDWDYINMFTRFDHPGLALGPAVWGVVAMLVSFVIGLPGFSASPW